MYCVSFSKEKKGAFEGEGERVKTDEGGTVISKDTRGDVFYIHIPTLVKGNTISRLREGLVHLG